MKRPRNNTIFTGLVGSRMRPRTFRGATRRIVRAGVKCATGPWTGHTLWLDAFADKKTLTVRIGRHVGQYAAGKWIPGAAAP